MENAINITLDCQVCGSGRRKKYLPARLDGFAHINPEHFSPFNSLYGHFQIVECLDCGFLYSTPIADVSRIGYEEAPVDALEKVLLWKEKTNRRELKIIERHIAKGKLLDIGCGLGAFLHVAQESGWEAVGIEPNPEAARAAQARGLNVIQAYFDSNSFPPNTFDCVILAGVLDHLLDARGVIRACHRLLKPSGGIWVTVTNGRGFLARVLRSRFPGFQYQHLYYFSRKTVARFLAANGFDVIHLRSNRISYPFGYYLKNIENRFPLLVKIMQALIITDSIPLTLPIGSLEALGLKI